MSIQWQKIDENRSGSTHTHNRFTAGLEYVQVHPGQQVPERLNQDG